MTCSSCDQPGKTLQACVPRAGGLAAKAADRLRGRDPADAASVSQEFSRGFLEQIAAIDPQAELVVVMTPLTLNWLPSLQGAWQLAFEFVR